MVGLREGQDPSNNHHVLIKFRLSRMDASYKPAEGIRDPFLSHLAVAIRFCKECSEQYGDEAFGQPCGNGGE